MRPMTAVVSALVLLTGCQAMRHEESSSPAMKTTVVNGAEIHYVEQGSGETVVFLHGAGTDWRIWEGVRPLIAKEYRFVAYSRRHHYPNAWPDDGSSHHVNQHAEDLAAFIRVLGVSRAHIVAASLGGQVAGRMLLMYPALVATAVLNDSLLGSPVPDESKPEMEEFSRRFGPVRAAVRAGNAEQATMALVDWVSEEPGAWGKLSETRRRQYL